MKDVENSVMNEEMIGWLGIVIVIDGMIFILCVIYYYIYIYLL